MLLSAICRRLVKDDERLDSPSGRLRGKEFLFQHTHLFQQLVGTPSLGLIQAADGEADVDQDVITPICFGHEVQADFAPDSAELDLADNHPADDGFCQ